MRSIVISPKFKKHVKKVVKYPKFNQRLLDDTVGKIQSGEKLDVKLRDHAASKSSPRELLGTRILHLSPNICMIYKLSDDAVTLLDIGSHQDTGLTEGSMKFLSVEASDDIFAKAKLTEDVITEDKVVKFNGQTNPPYGWCVILCGGSGIGKSTAADLLVPINARRYDVDALKSDRFYKISYDGDDHTITFNNGESYVLEDEGIFEPYDMQNPDFVSWLHQKRRPMAKKLKKSIFKAGEYADKERLPNILFDITGKDVEDFESIISEVKPIGYKVAVVWVLGEIKQAISQNEKRGRQVPRDVLLKAHRGVFNAIGDIAMDAKLFSQIDEFWVILQSVFDVGDPNDVDRYRKLANVYKIERRGDALMLPDKVKQMYDDQIREIAKLISEKED